MGGQRVVFSNQPEVRDQTAKNNRPPELELKRAVSGKNSYFFFFFVAAAAWAAWVLAMRCWNLSTRPAVSTNFCVPV